MSVKTVNRNKCYSSTLNSAATQSLPAVGSAHRPTSFSCSSSSDAGDRPRNSTLKTHSSSCSKTKRNQPQKKTNKSHKDNSLIY